MKKEEATLVGALLLCAFCGGLVGSFIQDVRNRKLKEAQQKNEELIDGLTIERNHWKSSIGDFLFTIGISWPEDKPFDRENVLRFAEETFEGYEYATTPEDWIKRFNNDLKDHATVIKEGVNDEQEA